MKELEKHNSSREKRSCMDSTLTLKQMVEKRLEHNFQTHLAFIDLIKVYDSVLLPKLWTALENQGIGHKNKRGKESLHWYEDIRR